MSDAFLLHLLLHLLLPEGFRIKISADGPAQRRGGSANGKSARTIKKSFLKIYTFDAAKTVRIVLAIQSHPVFGPGHQLIKKWLDLKIWGKASRFWNDSADEANAEVSRCSAKLKGSDLRFVVQFQGSELKYQQNSADKKAIRSEDLGASFKVLK